VQIPGTTETLWFQKGAPAIVMPAFAAAFNTYIEPLDNSAGYSDEGTWTQTNSVGTSNHLGATAMDLNWVDHPMGPDPITDPDDSGWSGSTLINGNEVPAVRELLTYCEGMIYWGGDWTTPKDSMHFQMGYGTYDPATGQSGTAALQDFIARKINPDGTLKWVPSWLGGAATPGDPPVTTDAAAVLAAAVGSMSATQATTILPQITAGLIGSECTTVLRIAAWLAEEGEESANFTATVEIGDIDGTTYQGRTWEQITGVDNYGAFSQWCFNKGLVDSPTYFVDNPAALGDVQWESLGATWYWTVARPNINAMADAGDIEGITVAINGGTNGLQDRIDRYNRALAQGDALLTLINQGDDMSWTPDAAARASFLLEQIAGQFRPSLSPLHWPGEGNVNTDAGFAQTADGNVHILLVEKLAVTYGDTQSIALLWAVTNDPDPTNNSTIAAAILAKVPADFTAAAKTAINEWLTAEGKPIIAS
jgi:predicted chitinase